MTPLRYVTNPLAEWLCLEGQWMIFDPTTKLLQTAQCPSPAVWRALSTLNALCEEPRSEQEILTHLGDAKLARADAAALFASACELGMLIPEAELDIWHRRAKEASSHQVLDAIRFLSLLPCQEYLDYSRPTVFQEDRRNMLEQIAQGEPQPPIIKEYPDVPRLVLPHPSLDPPTDPLRRLSHLLFFTFGALRQSLFLGLLPMLHKTVPSMGARHPLEAYLLVGERAPVKPGVYHYEVLYNALAQIAPQDGAAGPGCTLVVTALFERSLWRYRHNLGYKDVLHDLGHVTATLHMLAEDLGIPLEEIEELPPWSHTRRLEEDPMAAFRIGVIS